MAEDIFDHLAPIYDLFMDHTFHYAREGIIDKLDLEGNPALLDVGGGTGTLLKKIKKKESDINPYLLDTSREMMSESTTDNLVSGKACKTPFEDSSFDYVLCTDALHHFKNKEKSLEEMMRVLKSGGQIIILEFDPKSLITKFIEFGEKMIGESSSFFEPGYLKSFFRERGFSATIVRLDSYKYVLWAAKR
ncbi:MAG: methyltransferase domain-containing protein [Candidatus Thermoplasmatota archaeon]